MKKTYIFPETEVIKIETQQMLALSAGVNKSETTNSVDASSMDDDIDW